MFSTACDVLLAFMRVTYQHDSSYITSLTRISIKHASVSHTTSKLKQSNQIYTQKSRSLCTKLTSQICHDEYRKKGRRNRGQDSDEAYTDDEAISESDSDDERMPAVSAQEASADDLSAGKLVHGFALFMWTLASCCCNTLQSADLLSTADFHLHFVYCLQSATAVLLYAVQEAYMPAMYVLYHRCMACRSLAFAR